MRFAFAVLFLGLGMIFTSVYLKGRGGSKIESVASAAPITSEYGMYCEAVLPDVVRCENKEVVCYDTRIGGNRAVSVWCYKR